MRQPTPYKGLAPYGRDDQHHFFGRDHEKERLLGQILSHQTTLLYAASGVGKSSLLGAALIPELEALDKENLDVAYHRSWIHNPVHTIQHTVKQTLRRRHKMTDDEMSQLDDCALPEFFDRCAAYSSDPLVLILDQFEELFRYHGRRSNFLPFIDQLAAMMTDPKLAITVIIAMREDFLAELSVFRGRVPELFNNGFRLQKLTLEQARDAIVKPVEHADFGCRYEPALLDVLLTDLAEHEWRQTSAERPDAARPASPYTAIEGAYLQIVCTALWQQTQDCHDKVIRGAAYDDLGGAKTIVKRYFERMMHACPPSERRLASRAFTFLVTESGAKMAYPEEVLAKILNVKRSTLKLILDKLKAARILRDEVRPEGTWYELYHDVFANIIEAWNRSFQQRRGRRLKAALIGLTLAFLCTLGIAGYQGYQIAQHNARLARNAGTLIVNNKDSAKLALSCVRHYDPAQACPTEPLLLRGTSIALSGPADYVLVARTANWQVTYPIYIDGVTHQLVVDVTPPPHRLPSGMVYIPGGVFRMGDKAPWDVKGLENERPSHDVEVTGFYMDAHEVTNAHYQQCIQAGVCTPPHYRNEMCYDPTRTQMDQAFIDALKPVVCVNWQQARVFCDYTGKRLPTEAEWEKAAAGPEGYMWSFGSTFDATQANTSESDAGGTAPVATYAANSYGLYDMSGNASEWVADGYDEAFYGKPQASSPNPINRPAAGRPRVHRGGSWWHGIEGVRTSRRHWDAPDEISTLTGFRCAKSADAPSDS